LGVKQIAVYMNLKKAFEIINNLNVRQPLRKYQPQWCTIVISSNGDIVDIIKYKEQPDLTSNKDDLLRYPDTIQITAWQDCFSSIDDLKRVVKESVDLGINY
jgi:hypothetical protein